MAGLSLAPDAADVAEGVAAELPGLELADEAQHLLALVRREVLLRPALRLGDELHEARTLVRLQQAEVPAREERDLGDGEYPKPEHDLILGAGEGGLALRDRESAFVEGAADDHARQRREISVGEIAQV